MDGPASSARHRLAIYDLDRTITRWPTWTPFLLHAAARHTPWRLALVPLVVGAAGLRAAGLLHRDRLKQIMHRLALGTLTPDRAEAIAAGWIVRFGPAQIRAAARAQIARDRSDGYRIVVATAAYRFYARAIADAVGADALIATEVARDARGHLLPRIAGPNCYGRAKLAMIQAWMDDEGMRRGDTLVRVYSDHVSDAPTLAWADEPVAVSPHRALHRLAMAHGWREVDWDA